MDPKAGSTLDLAERRGVCSLHAHALTWYGVPSFVLHISFHEAEGPAWHVCPILTDSAQNLAGGRQDHNVGGLTGRDILRKRKKKTGKCCREPSGISALLLSTQALSRVTPTVGSKPDATGFVLLNNHSTFTNPPRCSMHCIKCSTHTISFNPSRPLRRPHGEELGAGLSHLMTQWVGIWALELVSSL